MRIAARFIVSISVVLGADGCATAQQGINCCVGVCCLLPIYLAPNNLCPCGSVDPAPEPIARVVENTPADVPMDDGVAY